MQLQEGGEDFGGELIEGVLDVGQKEDVLVLGALRLEALQCLGVQPLPAHHEEVDDLRPRPQVLLQVQPRLPDRPATLGIAGRGYHSHDEECLAEQRLFEDRDLRLVIMNIS